MKRRGDAVQCHRRRSVAGKEADEKRAMASAPHLWPRRRLEDAGPAKADWRCRRDHRFAGARRRGRATCSPRDRAGRPAHFEPISSPWRSRCILCLGTVGGAGAASARDEPVNHEGGPSVALLPRFSRRPPGAGTGICKRFPRLTQRLETYPHNTHMPTTCRVHRVWHALILDARSLSALNFDGVVTAGGDAFDPHKRVSSRV